MAKKRSFEWRGDAVKSAVRRAETIGVNRTMSESAIHAKSNHTWRNRTGTLEGSIRIVNFAAPHARGVRGVWGSADVVYALRMELGFQGADALGRSINQPARPYLRPAADAVYPRLAAYIREALG